MGEKKARWNAGCKAKIVYDSKYVELHRKEKSTVKEINIENPSDNQMNDESKQTE